jgi:hypothetical protein
LTTPKRNQGRDIFSAVIFEICTPYSRPQSRCIKLGVTLFHFSQTAVYVLPEGETKKTAMTVSMLMDG